MKLLAFLIISNSFFLTSAFADSQATNKSLYSPSSSNKPLFSNPQSPTQTNQNSCHKDDGSEVAEFSVWCRSDHMLYKCKKGQWQPTGKKCTS